MAFDPARVRRDYGDPWGEARSCRQHAALFDFSFIACAAVSGPRAAEAVQTLTGRPIASVRPGRIGYAVREGGGRLVSDLTVWCHSETHYWVMTGREQDVLDLARTLLPGAQCHDLSAGQSIFALQGPKSLAILAPLVSNLPETLAHLSYYGHAPATVAGCKCRVGRLG